MNEWFKTHRYSLESVEDGRSNSPTIMGLISILSARKDFHSAVCPLFFVFLLVGRIIYFRYVYMFDPRG